MGEQLPADKRLEMVERTSEERCGPPPGDGEPGSGLRAATMADSDLDVRPASEQAILDEVRIDDGWQRLQEFSHLVRDLGSEDEARSVERITSRLDAWGIPYRVHRPELLVSLPRSASLTVDGVEVAAKTP